MKKLILAIAVSTFMAGMAHINAQGTVAPVKTTPKQVDVTKRDDAKATDHVNPSLKGPKGETVFTGPKGGHYYLAKNGGKIYLDANVDPRFKGPKGEKVYTGPQGGKYFINSSGEKVYLNNKNDKVPDKTGTVKKAESAPTSK